MGAEENHLNEAVLLNALTFFFCTHLSIYLSIYFFTFSHSCIHSHFLFMCELFIFCNVEMVAIYAVLTGDDVTSFGVHHFAHWCVDNVKMYKYAKLDRKICWGSRIVSIFTKRPGLAK